MRLEFTLANWKLKIHLSKISLDLIADAVHANRCYISRIYKERTGEKLFETINRKKLKLPGNILKTER